jgi:hypothetical protein
LRDVIGIQWREGVGLSSQPTCDQCVAVLVLLFDHTIEVRQRTTLIIFVPFTEEGILLEGHTFALTEAGQFKSPKADDLFGINIQRPDFFDLLWVFGVHRSENVGGLHTEKRQGFNRVDFRHWEGDFDRVIVYFREDDWLGLTIDIDKVTVGIRAFDGGIGEDFVTGNVIIHDHRFAIGPLHAFANFGGPGFLVFGNGEAFGLIRNVL